MKKVKTLFKRYWKDTEGVGFMEDEYFTKWLEQLHTHVNAIMVNAKSMTVQELRDELYGHKDFLYVTNGYANYKDNSIIIKDNLNREFYIQDMEMLEHTVELEDVPEYVEVNDAPLEADEFPL
ncbi:hypothetical protein [Clostridium beijerinckii]|uniref:Uncharacterized protein n=1 Tax=Clostridium beijerinckii TaxID=1520 RepID=A0AAE5LN26_CLOBE|nr:hypothetical protein [Clostridium beijerinckii]NSB12098.1 hypothetical protein [Clostridium beijerinckii]OOM27432.1 hypothetical protein CLOBE_29900 [Clostridium beijerinckii]